ncbi:MAG: hypothetical protein L0271_26980 [Gemmatimonadetes bacterium]|nr:hypothetical protein [Gemmatimonadota bacterium]
MTEFVFMFHSGLRYLVLLTAVVALGVLLAGLRTKPVSRGAVTAFRVFNRVLDVQVLAGIVVVLTRPFYGALMGHITMMVLAVIFADGAAIVHRRRPAERRTAGFLAASVALSLALIVAGILAIGRPIV